MDQLFLILLSLLVTGLAAVLFLLMKKKPNENEGSLLMLQQQINQLQQIVDNKLAESNKAIQTHFGQSQKIIQDVTEKLTQLEGTNKQVVGFAGQLQSLENILRNPKQRGVLG